MMSKEATIDDIPQVMPDRGVTNSTRPLSPRIDKGRIEFLDVLRGIAALFVVVQHSLQIVSPGFVHFANNYINSGEVGVVIFFIVSGFIIPVSLEKYNSLARFWLGRLLRLWPVYIASLLCAVAIHFFVHQLPTYYQAHPVVFILGNLTMFQEYLRIPFAIRAYWTLSLELVFYLLCSIIFLTGTLGRTRFWLASSALGLLLAQIGVALAFHRSLPAGRMGLIVTALFGTLLFRELKQGPSRKIIGAALIGVFLCFAVCFWIRFDLYPSIPGSSSPTVAPVSATCALASWMFAYLLFLAILALRKRTFPRIFIWVGQISYPLYLFHALVLAIMPAHLPPLVLLAAVLAASLPIAHVVHILIEKPVGRFQHKLLRHSAVVVDLNPH